MSFQTRNLELPEIKEILPEIRRDVRGFFSVTLNSARLAEFGLPSSWVQESHSLSMQKGVVRGLHYQTPPMAQDKLIRVVRGRIFDVAVNIRHGSPNFGRYASLELSAESWNQILIPKGFAHGFVTLEPGTEVVVKTSNYFSPEHDRSIRFDDPAIGIDWPLGEISPILSDKDRHASPLRDHQTGF